MSHFYLKLEATFLIGICSVGFASLVFIHWYALRVQEWRLVFPTLSRSQM